MAKNNLKLNWKEIKNDKTMNKIIFYKNTSEKIINDELFTNIANRWACKVSHPKFNKPTQVRRFFDFTKRHINAVKKNDKNALINFRLIVSKITDARNKKEPVINQDFENFIFYSLKNINDEKDLIIFGKFFEAFLGFYTLYSK
ncbi:hypothetical protein CRV00_06885 [Malaciobacter molluscorum]|uniref:type III-A CRISPR-associated protein Csm2 n=1 Tax=Malaciobacter molluscorum TaxID=1032072 RepID=UPI00100B247B|nr:type III-A CRISPR-associated protein Csm2 [Malaciobacter molluscorum]RXJ94647.1 hypothetical protein CRV00_06885 [Malaciobacter molluscorum]